MKFKKYDQVVTADDIILGDLLRIHHREEDVNSALQLYASYLEVWSIDMGGRTFIPTDFIDEYDAAARTVYISETLNTVQQETWDRAPNFVAGRKSRKEELPIEGIVSVA
ncbi:MAG: hypothetical protein DHS20C20_11860 [Ardenticatenaceae bacterium]|nr:MAG: hypothetical protein DHS20C20_11860 [Ardenticatenaceae bacterium]